MRCCWICARGLALPVCLLLLPTFAASRLQGQEVRRPMLIERSAVDRELGLYRNELLDELEFSRQEIRLTRAEIDSMRRQIRDYTRFPLSPFVLTLERRRVELLSAELRLDRLEKDYLRRQFQLSDEYRERRLELQRIREMQTIR